MTDSLFTRMGGRPALQKLLKHFYADVRQHQVIGPIFLEQIEDWPQHLEKIADFWSTIAGGPPAYGGAMVARHVPLNLKEEHFQAWLNLWQHNCRIWLPVDCAEEMIGFAQKIAQRLRLKTGLVPSLNQLNGTISFRDYSRSPS